MPNKKKNLDKVIAPEEQTSVPKTKIAEEKPKKAAPKKPLAKKKADAETSAVIPATKAPAPIAEKKASETPVEKSSATKKSTVKKAPKAKVPAKQEIEAKSQAKEQKINAPEKPVLPKAEAKPIEPKKEIPQESNKKIEAKPKVQEAHKTEKKEIVVPKPQAQKREIPAETNKVESAPIKAEISQKPQAHKPHHHANINKSEQTLAKVETHPAPTPKPQAPINANQASAPSVKAEQKPEAAPSADAPKQDNGENRPRQDNPERNRNNYYRDRYGRYWPKNNWKNKNKQEKRDSDESIADEKENQIVQELESAQSKTIAAPVNQVAEKKADAPDSFENAMLNEPLKDEAFKKEFDNSQRTKPNWNNRNQNNRNNQNRRFEKSEPTTAPAPSDNRPIKDAEKAPIQKPNWNNNQPKQAPIEQKEEAKKIEEVQIPTPWDFIPVEEIVEVDYVVLEEYFIEKKAQIVEQKPKEEPFIYENALYADDRIAKYYSKTLEFLKDKLLLREGDTIICAVSGGVDSVAMFDIIASVCANHGFKTAIAHFNHNLRGKESQDDERFLQRWTSQLGVKFYHSSMNVREYSEKNSMSIEEAARYLRYKFFEKTARSANSNVILTAHTQDDSVETFFLNLFRGSGLTGLSGIPEIRGIKKTKLIIARPLLQFRKSELIEYSNIRGLQWREDSSNKLKEFTRNKVRLSLLPYLESEFTPAIYNVIDRASNIISRADKFVSFYVRQKAPNVIVEKTNFKVSLNLGLLTTLDEFIQCEMLQFAVQDALLSNPLPIDAIERILDIANKDTGTMCDINKYLFAVRDRDELIIARKRQLNQINTSVDKVGKIDLEDRTIILKEIDKKDIKYSDNPLIEYFDSELIPKRFKLRNWANGDKFRPLGMQGETLLSDFLTNQKISVYDRQSTLLLSTSEDIFWVCGVRISEKFKVTEATTKVLRAEIIIKPLK